MVALFSGLLGSLLTLGTWLLIIRFLIRRCYVYRYIEIDGRRVAVPVGYIKSDGSVIDTTRKMPDRQHVGQVYVRDERGRVRLYFTEQGEEQKEEVGYVDLEGNVYTITSQNLGKVSTDGEQYWWELWLRRHADVPAEIEDPLGKCIETIRFRKRGPNELTLLARGGAALLLYYVKVKVEDEIPRPAPHVLWDTALPSSLLFAMLFLFPGWVAFIQNHLILLSILGPDVSYVATGFGIFLMIWTLLHFLKVTWLSFNDEILYYLTMINQQTGIRIWTLIGGGLALIGFIEGLKHQSTKYLPLYLASLLGFCFTYFMAPSGPWPIKPRSRADNPLGPLPPAET